jgi:hypothetical protein
LADDTFDQALGQYEGEDYYTAAASARLAVGLYNAQKTGMDAYNTWQEIVSRDFSKYDADNFYRAEEIGRSALDDYDDLEAESARTGAEDALLRFKLALQTGWQFYALEQRAAAGAERQAALDFKANVAVQADYDRAAAPYNQAEGYFRAEQYSDAAPLYVESLPLFAHARQIAEDKRLLAGEAIRTAEERTAESAAVVQDAEKILGGGTQ